MLSQSAEWIACGRTLFYESGIYHIHAIKFKINKKKFIKFIENRVNTKNQQFVYFADELKMPSSNKLTGIKKFKILKIGLPFRILEVTFFIPQNRKITDFSYSPYFR